MRRRSWTLGCAAALWPLRVFALSPAAHEARAGRLQRWQALIEDAREVGAEQRIDLVHAAVHRLVADDPDADTCCWPTPLEALQRGSGDCRTFAVLKFFALRAAGHDAADVRLLYAIQQRPETPGLQRPHLVAWARDAGGPPRVLDNLLPFPLTLAQRPDLRVVFSLDCEHLREGLRETVARPAGALRPWRELLERHRAQG